MGRMVAISKKIIPVKKNPEQPSVCDETYDVNEKIWLLFLIGAATVCVLASIYVLSQLLSSNPPCHCSQEEMPIEKKYCPKGYFGCSK